MPHQYARTHQCARCGITRPLSAIKQVKRFNEVINLNDTPFVCIDEQLCAHLKLEHAQLLERELAKPIVGKGGRPKKTLKKPRPSRSKKMRQVFPLLDTPLSRAARLKARKAVRRQ